MDAAWYASKLRPFLLPDGKGCRVWSRARGSDGYGQVWVPGVGMRRVHRVVWEHLRGPVPEGLQIDHLCRERGCANVEHLEVVSGRLNMLRGATVNADQVARTHCPQGHPLEAGNLRMSQAWRGRRACLACHHATAAAQAAAVKAAHEALGLTQRQYAAEFGWSERVAVEVLRRVQAGEPLDGVRAVAPGSGHHGKRTITVRPDPALTL